MLFFSKFFAQTVEAFANGAMAVSANPGVILQGLGWAVVGSSAIQFLHLFNSDTETEVDEELERAKNRFEYIFSSTDLKNKFGTKPRLIKMVKNSLGTNYVVKIPTGLTLDNIAKIKDVMQNELRYKVNISSIYDKVSIQTVEYPLLDKYELKKHTEKIPQDKNKANFILGVIKDADGEEYPVLNLTSEFCHLLIAGVSGSGKSGCFKNIFAQLAHKDIDVWILDMKRGVETRMLEDLQNIKRYEYKSERSARFISALNSEMQRRYDIIGNAKCKDYKDYNKKHPGTPIRPLVVMIEEISELNRLYPQASDELRSIMMLSRAANISVIATIQRPDSKMLDSASKSQFQNRISFKQVDEINSNIALGNNLAVEALKGEPIGRGIVQTEQLVDKMFQSFYMEDKDLLHFLKDKVRVRDKEAPKGEESSEKVGDMITGKPIAIDKMVEPKKEHKAALTPKENKEANEKPLKSIKDYIPQNEKERLMINVLELMELLKKTPKETKKNAAVIDTVEKKKDQFEKKKSNVDENLIFN